jgi:hypothetical protein
MKITDLLNPAYVYSRRDRIVPYLRAKTNETVAKASETLHLHHMRIYMAMHGLGITANDRLLAALKGRYKDKRCFVIGNGPSLRIEDLNKLGENDDITIASNKIYLAFEETNWRPTYYTVADLLVAENNAHQIKKLDQVKLFPENLKLILGESRDLDCRGTSLYYRSLKGGEYDENGNYIFRFSSNALDGFHVGQTVTNLNIQLAYYLGCNPIYIIGIDGVYETPSTTKRHDKYGQVLVSQGEESHFHKDYRKPGETWSIPKPDYHEISYQCCRRFLESCGVKILNASRRSFVKAFERVDLDSIL